MCVLVEPGPDAMAVCKSKCEAAGRVNGGPLRCTALNVVPLHTPPLAALDPQNVPWGAPGCDKATLLEQVWVRGNGG